MIFRYPLRCLTTLAAALASAAALADVARLNNGGEVRGLLQSNPLTGDVVELETVLGGRVVLARSEIASVSRRSPLVEEYVTRSREIPNTVEAHWELAEWTRLQRLTAQRDEQLEAVLAIDPGHEGARKGLNHIRYRGEWMTRDTAMRAQGYVKYKGRFITREELALVEKTSAERKAEVAWYPRIRLWVAWLAGSHADKQTEGLMQLRSVDDPDAIPALDEFLGDSQAAALRALFVERLAAMTGEKPIEPLVRVSLSDPVELIRTAAFQGLSAERYAKAIPYYVEALDHAENAVVQRAATALGTFGDVRSVPPLIRALITSHKVAVQVPVRDAVSIARSSNGRYSIGGSQPTLPPDVEIMLRTGQLPYGVRVVDPSLRYETVEARVDVRNEKVLEALRELTQQDFGYDQDAWLVYWAARKSGVGKL